MSGSFRIGAIISLVSAMTLLAGFSLTSCYIEPVALQRPAFDYKAKAEGCGGIFVYKWNAATSEAILVSAKKEELGLSTQARTFRLDSVDMRHLSVWVDVYDAPRRSSPYCTDVIDGSQSVPTTWRATSGLVTIVLDRDSVPAFETYKATVTLENVHFRSGNGVEVELERESFNDVVVGWFPG